MTHLRIILFMENDTFMNPHASLNGTMNLISDNFTTAHVYLKLK